jgi:SAM-dependent methyltransferase
LNRAKIENYERAGMQKEFYSASELEYATCPFCDNDQYKEIYKERGALGIVRCLSCGLLYVNPRLKDPEKVYWGDVDKYFKEARMIFEGNAKHHRDPNYTADLRLIYKYQPVGKFLDIGANMGFFLRKARAWQWDLYGVEPSPSLSEMARRYFDLHVKTSFLENAGFEDNFFDVVTMTDVFEHIPQPGRILSQIHKVLKPGGILFIKVPNGLFNLCKFYLAKIMGKLGDYDIFDSYEHLVHYSDRTLRQMLNKYGFKVIKMTVGRPIQVPVWHNYVGQYYQYPSPWILDPVRRVLRITFYWLSLLEFWLRIGRVGYLAPNIITVAKKN